MPRSAGWLPVRAAIALATLAVCAHASEVPFKSVPKAVQETILSRFKEARVAGAARERGEDKKLVYEISLRENDKNIDVTLTPAGQMITIEKEIARGDLPDPAAAALNQKFPDAQYGMVETVYKVKAGKETLAYYEARLMDSGKHAWAVEVAGNGAILNLEKKKGLGED